MNEPYIGAAFSAFKHDEEDNGSVSRFLNTGPP
jgi:hypothetical protein